MSVGDMLSDPFFSPTPATRRRFSTPALDNTSGYFGTPVQTDTVVTGSLQRPSGKTLSLFPQGQRADEAVIYYTAADFRTADAAAQVQADQLIVAGVAYEVKSVSPWAQGGYSRLACVKVGA